MRAASALLKMNSQVAHEVQRVLLVTQHIDRADKFAVAALTPDFESD